MTYKEFHDKWSGRNVTRSEEDVRMYITDGTVRYGGKHWLKLLENLDTLYECHIWTIPNQNGWGYVKKSEWYRDCKKVGVKSAKKFYGYMSFYKPTGTTKKGK